MSTHLESLKADCHVRGTPSDSEKIREGASVWIAGFAVPAEAGHVGLSIGPNQSVVLSESAIVEVEKDKGLYLVRVKAGTTALVRSEAAATVRQPECDCAHPSSHSLTRQTGGGTSGGTLGGLCHPVCIPAWECGVYFTSAGEPRMICVPSLKCQSSCPPLA
jgi:hypothetical protein